MRKIIALVLTVMMIASLAVTGLAVRVQNAEYVVTPEYSQVLDTTVGEGTYMYCGDINLGAGSIVEFDLWLAEGMGTYSEAWGLAWLSLHTDRLGVGGSTVSATLEPETWYHLRFEVGSGETTIYVDGEELGTVASQLDKFACGIEGAKIDNIHIVNANEQEYNQDFEGYAVGTDVMGRWYFAGDGAGSSQVADALISTSTTLQVNKNVNLYAVANKVLDTTVGEGTYVYCGDINLGAGSIVEFDLWLAEGMGTYSEAWGLAWASLHTDRLGVGGASVSATLAPETWYTVRFEVGSGETEIFLDGTSVGTVASQLDKFAFGIEGAKIDNIHIVNANDQEYNQNFEGYAVGTDVMGRWYFAGDGAGSSQVSAIQVPVESDLGMKYAYYDNDNAIYFFVNGPKNVTAKWEFDAQIFADTDCGYPWLDTPGPGLAIDGVGVGGDRLAYTFTDGEWYHIVLDSTGGNGTDVYVDGALVGTVNTAIDAFYCGNGTHLGIDNLAVVADNFDVFSDFEDGTFGPALHSDGGALILNYDFDVTPLEPEKDIFDYIETDTPGGNAYILGGGYDYAVGQSSTNVPSNYFDLSGCAPGAHEYVINFDLALVPETDSSGYTYMEIWSNEAQNGWCVGNERVGRTYNGRTDQDFVAYEDWGTADKDTFHNVTYVFRGAQAYIYIDEVLVYNYGCPTNQTWDNNVVGHVWNGTAIIDNFKVYRYTDSNILQPNELEEVYTTFSGEDHVRAIDLDAADFCASNGHIQEHTTRTLDPLCEATGTDVTYCAVCGQEAKTTVVPALGHSWPNYFNGVQKGDGEWSWACKRGCGATVSTTVPEDYDGELYMFLDFADAIVVQNVADIFHSDYDEYVDEANGVGIYPEGNGNTYNLFYIPQAIHDAYTVSFDIRLDGLYDTNDTESYGHMVEFWFGGPNGMRNHLGYNFDNNMFFLKDDSGSEQFYPTEEYEYFVPDDGEFHQIMLKVFVGEKDEYDEYDEVWVALYLDGEEIIVFDDLDYTPGSIPTTVDWAVIRDFGVACAIDNFAIGDIDFQIPFEAPVLRGDIDGDGVITSKDAREFKKILAGLRDEPEDIRIADINGDGNITSQDYRALKALLVA
ncbi:MAG: dockerin type I repeat-containing protein [Clostridia bacterium]|nr:dockerin type I repeat-containing protein [Clostridia bacterium]